MKPPSVRRIRAKDIHWDWEGGPRVVYGQGDAAKIDPTPCYPHDEVLVRQTLQRCSEAFPPRSPLTVWLLEHETTARTNGWSSYRYQRQGQRAPAGGDIVLSGKRVPIHPAMTRYLVAHEYGHHVQTWIEADRGMDRDALHAEYIALRGLKEQPYYGPGTWHLSPGELLACDFRILVAQTELEFWPHPGTERPEAMPKVQAWWQDALGDLRALRKAT